MRELEVDQKKKQLNSIDPHYPFPDTLRSYLVFTFVVIVNPVAFA